MNDFTKEELESLFITLDVYICCLPDFDYQIKDKIKLMIDNYCEHKEQFEDYDCTITRCKKCFDVLD